MRNMAYGVTISKIDDIKGKDKIGLAHFKENAYTVIVPKTCEPLLTFRSIAVHLLDPKGNKNHEGIVIRTADMKIHFKVKSREYGL